MYTALQVLRPYRPGPAATGNGIIRSLPISGLCVSLFCIVTDILPVFHRISGFKLNTAYDFHASVSK